MTNAIVAAVAIALILGATLILTNAALTSASQLSVSWDDMIRRKGDIARAEMTLITADILATSTDIDISVRNSGQTAMTNFPDWDLTIRYYASSNNIDLNISYLTYATSTPATGEWTVQEIYADYSELDTEIYEPDVFNPGEEMLLKVNITPAIPTNTDNVVIIGADNGISLPATFSR